MMTPAWPVPAVDPHARLSMSQAIQEEPAPGRMSSVKMWLALTLAAGGIVAAALLLLPALLRPDPGDARRPPRRPSRPDRPADPAPAAPSDPAKSARRGPGQAGGGPARGDAAGRGRSPRRAPATPAPAATPPAAAAPATASEARATGSGRRHPRASGRNGDPTGQEPSTRRSTRDVIVAAEARERADPPAAPEPTGRAGQGDRPAFCPRAGRRGARTSTGSPCARSPRAPTC